jgi:hypothetical protein
VGGGGAGVVVVVGAGVVVVVVGAGVVVVVVGAGHGGIEYSMVKPWSTKLKSDEKEIVA